MPKIKNLDESNLRQVILDFPDQFKAGFELAKKTKINKAFKSVCVSGMGGSALPVDILKDYISYLNIKNPRKNKIFPLYQNRTYNLPPEAYHYDLNIFASYSGNTEETLKSLNEAVKNNLPSIGISHGGKLMEICQKNNLPCIRLPYVVQPRLALGYFFSIMLEILNNENFLEDTSKEMIPSAEKLKNNIYKLERQGKKIARILKGKTPVIHAPTRFGSAAMILKIKINENAKTPAFWNVYPELSHNEMVGYTLPQAKFHILSFIDKDDNPKNIKRIRITANILKKYGVNTTLIEISGKTFFEKIFGMIILGDWISYYLALSYGQDPTPVKMVEDLKNSLK